MGPGATESGLMRSLQPHRRVAPVPVTPSLGRAGSRWRVSASTGWHRRGAAWRATSSSSAITARVYAGRAVGQQRLRRAASAGSTNSPARNPGIDPVCPTKVPRRSPTAAAAPGRRHPRADPRRRQRARCASRAATLARSESGSLPARTRAQRREIGRSCSRAGQPAPSLPVSCAGSRLQFAR